MKLPGIVTNLTAFGAFVDIGVHQDGLVHLSQIADRFVKDPGEVLKVRQILEVTVLGVDLERRRISLTLKKEPVRKTDPQTKAAAPVAERRQSATAAKGVSSAGTGGAGRKVLREKGAPGRPDSGKKSGQSQRDKPHPVRPQPSKGRAEKVPFNNPFIEVFGRK